jgi:hypothetical protein
MKIIKFVFIIIFINSLLINSFCLTNTQQKLKDFSKRNFWAGILIGNYNVKDERFEKIYRKKRSILGFELIYEFYREKTDKYIIEGGLSLKFYSVDGYSTITKDYTKFYLHPYILNLRGKFQITEIFKPFVGFGFDYYSYKEECMALKTTYGGKIGYHIEVGGCLEIPELKDFGIRGYLKYTIVNTEENNIKVKLGGNEFGVGIFYRFSI